MNDFAARNSPWRLALLALGCVGAAVAGGWLAGLFGESPRPAFEWLGWLTIVFSSACSVVCLYRAFDGKTVLRIGEAGIWYPHHSHDVIPWSEIKEFYVWTYQRQRIIVLKLHHPELYPRSGPMAFMASTNRALTGGDVAIGLVGTDRSVDDALAAIERHKRNPN